MMLRAGKHPVAGSHPHTYLTRSLYADVLESEYLYQARLSRLNSWASLHGHPDADLEATNQQMRLHFIDAIGTIPYITSGKSGVDALHQERIDFANRYKAYKEQVLQGRKMGDLVRKPKKRSSGIQLIGKAND